MEPITRLASLEQARNAAIEWLQRRGAVFGPNRDIVIGRLGAMEGSEAGVQSTAGPFWRIRLDFDPSKGPHYNVEFGTGAQRLKHAFAFPGSAELFSRLAARRRPRG
jgi:hypothetical protein